MSTPILPMAPCCATPGIPRLKRGAELARLFRALADETRLRILALLKDGEVCVCHMQSALQAPQPTISRHLAYLRKAGLVDARRDGIWMHYRLAEHADPVTSAALHSVLHALTHVEQCDRDATRLKKTVAG